MKKIVLIDYGTSNLFSIKNAILKLGYKNIIISDKYKEVLNADLIVLPGVGSFKKAMVNLKKKKLDIAIKQFANFQKPILAICLGFQLLFSESEEFGNCKGLNILEGKVLNLNKKINIIPNIGWFSLDLKIKKKTFVKNLNILKKKLFYFVHSYYVLPQNKKIIFTNSTIQRFKFCSSILYKNIYACQFHPEKSGKHGLDLIRNFINSHGI